MEVKSGYKQTEVGVIPEEWDVRTLAQTAKRITRGASPRPIDSPAWFDARSSVGWVRISDVTRSGRYLTETTQRLSEAGIRNSRPVPSGSLIMSICATVGRPIETRIDACIHDGFVVFDQPAVHQSFLYHVLAALEPTWSKRGQTGSQMNLNTGLINGCLIPLPPTDAEQRAIAEALSDVDGLLGGLDRLIAKKRDLKQAAMQQLLTGQTRLPGFHGEWEVKSLFGIAEHKKELFDDGDWIEAEYLAESGVRLVQTGNIGEGHFADKQERKYISEASFKKLRCKALEVGDILICRLAEPAGRACILPDLGEEKVITAVDVTIFRPPASVADRRFLVNVFNTRQWFETVNERCGGSTRTRIARGQLGKIEIELPTLAEQTAIAEVLTEMDMELAALEQRREKTRALKQAMMQELLTGRTRLV
jgi:type I restriction enzyme S subunit